MIKTRFTVEISIGRDTDGRYTDQGHLLFINALRNALEAEFPDVNIAVEMGRDGSGLVRVSGFDGIDDVEEKANLIKASVFDHCLYRTVTTTH